MSVPKVVQNQQPAQLYRGVVKQVMILNKKNFFIQSYFY